MSVKIGADGWIEIPHTGDATDQCHIGFGRQEPEEWHPAFKRAKGRRRILVLPPPAFRGTVTVWTRINGIETRAGTISL